MFHSSVTVSPFILWNRRLPRRPWRRSPVPTSLGTNTAAPPVMMTSLTTRHAPCSVTIPASSWFRIPDMYWQCTPALELAQGLSDQDCLHCYVNVSSGLSRGSPTVVGVAAHAGAGYWNKWRTCMRTSHQISFSLAISPVNTNYQSNRRTKHFPLLQSLIMNLCIIHYNSTQTRS